MIHSGARAEGVAEYAELEPDGRRISYHLAWSKNYRQFVQMVPLTHRAWHAGREGNHWIGIALMGPWHLDPRTPEERHEFRRVLGILLDAMPCLIYWCRHSDINQHKRDPGPGFEVKEWLRGFDERLTWRRASV